MIESDDIETLNVLIPWGVRSVSQVLDDEMEVSIVLLQQNIIENLQEAVKEEQLEKAMLNVDFLKEEKINKALSKQVDLLAGQLKSSSLSVDASSVAVAMGLELERKYLDEISSFKQLLAESESRYSELEKQANSLTEALNKRMHTTVIDNKKHLVQINAVNVENSITQTENKKLRATIDVLNKEKYQLSKRSQQQVRDIAELTEKVNSEQLRFSEKSEKVNKPLHEEIALLKGQLDTAKDIIDAQTPLINQCTEAVSQSKEKLTSIEARNEESGCVFAASLIQSRETNEKLLRAHYINNLMQRSLEVFSCTTGDVYLLSLYAKYLPKEHQGTDYPLFIYLHQSGKGQVLFIQDDEVRTMEGLSLHEDLQQNKKKLFSQMTRHTSKEIEEALLSGSKQAIRSAKLSHLSEEACQSLLDVKDYFEVEPFYTPELQDALAIVKEKSAAHKAMMNSFIKKEKGRLKKNKTRNR